MAIESLVVEEEQKLPIIDKDYLETDLDKIQEKSEYNSPEDQAQREREELKRSIRAIEFAIGEKKRQVEEMSCQINRDQIKMRSYESWIRQIVVNL